MKSVYHGRFEGLVQGEEIGLSFDVVRLARGGESAVRAGCARLETLVLAERRTRGVQRFVRDQVLGMLHSSTALCN